MKTLHVNGLKNYEGDGWGLADIIDGTLTQATAINYCRAYMGDALFYKKNPISKRTPCFPLHKDYNWKTGDTYVLFAIQNVNKTLPIVQKNLASLHEKEKRAGVKFSTIYATQHPNVFVMKGSGHWKNSCWKQLLYTFYIKHLYFATKGEYDKSYWNQLDRDGNEDQLLSKVKIKTEIFHPDVYGVYLNWNVHDREGFVSICFGKNPPMSKLLGVKTEISEAAFNASYKVKY